MVGLSPVSSRSSYSVTVSNVAYMVHFTNRMTCQCFSPDRVVGRVAELAYDTWIISFKESQSGPTLIVGRLLMTNLATNFSIVFGFDYVDISVFLFLIRRSLLALSFLAILLIMAEFYPVRSEDTTCRQNVSVANLGLT